MPFTLCINDGALPRPVLSRTSCPHPPVPPHAVCTDVHARQWLCCRTLQMPGVSLEGRWTCQMLTATPAAAALQRRQQGLRRQRRPARLGNLGSLVTRPQALRRAWTEWRWPQRGRRSGWLCPSMLCWQHSCRYALTPPRPSILIKTDTRAGGLCSLGGRRLRRYCSSLLNTVQQTQFVRPHL